MDIQNTRGHSEKNSYNLPPYTNDQLRSMLSLIDKQKINKYQLNNIEDLKNAIENGNVDLNDIFNTKEQFYSLIDIFHLRNGNIPPFLQNLKLKGGKRRSKKRRGNRRKSTRRRSRR